MKTIEMPKNYDYQPSEYAGKEPAYPNGKVMQTISGQRIVITDYLQNLGLYVVSNIDGSNTRSPLYKIHPDKLRET